MAEQHTNATETLRTTISMLKEELTQEEQTKLNLMKIIEEKDHQISHLPILEGKVSEKDKQIG
jgi:hypothetical protein